MRVSTPPKMTFSEITRRIKWKTSGRLIEEFPRFEEEILGRNFRERGYLCAAEGQMTEEMIRPCLEHHFEPNAYDGSPP